VLGVGPNYEWAVVIGGQPTEELPDGCTTREEGTYNSGLWLFTRAQLATKAEISAMHDLLRSKGIAISRLHDVEQAGCKYEGAFRK